MRLSEITEARYYMESRYDIYMNGKPLKFGRWQNISKKEAEGYMKATIQDAAQRNIKVNVEDAGATVTTGEGNLTRKFEAIPKR